MGIAIPCKCFSKIIPVNIPKWVCEQSLMFVVWSWGKETVSNFSFLYGKNPWWKLLCILKLHIFLAMYVPCIGIMLKNRRLVGAPSMQTSFISTHKFVTSDTMSQNKVVNWPDISPWLRIYANKNLKPLSARNTSCRAVVATSIPSPDLFWFAMPEFSFPKST